MLIIFLYTLPAPPSSFTIVYNFYCYFLVHILYCSFFSFCSDYLIILFLLLICMCKLSGTFQQGRKFNSFDKTLVRHRFFFVSARLYCRELVLFMLQHYCRHVFRFKNLQSKIYFMYNKMFLLFLYNFWKKLNYYNNWENSFAFPNSHSPPLNFYYIQIVTERNVLFSSQFE